MQADARSRYVSALAWAVLTGALCMAGSRTWTIGPVRLPPLGPLLSPWSGFWRNAEPKDARLDAFPTTPQPLPLRGLRGQVRVRYDARRVPHVFAQNDFDLAFAQGFVTARDRLWQMDIQVLATAGRLAEKLGPAALGHDRTQRRRGMWHSAKRNAAHWRTHEPTQFERVQAYSDGVNAYIDTLTRDTLPLEYKILGTTPERWDVVKTALLHKQMAWDLSGGSDDLRMTNNLFVHGRAAIDALFPAHNPSTEPVIPRGTPWEFTPSLTHPPHTPHTTAFAPRGLLDLSGVDSGPNQANGSNNWVVSGRKSASGLPILANDPHLGLRLPSIWYEIQLHSPTVNVYGVSLPGAPGVIVGFNDAIAWGVTNAGNDVVDFYDITFKDASRAQAKFGSQWLPTEKVREEIKVKGGPSETLEVVWTHRGPIVHELPVKGRPASERVMLAMRWAAHTESAELSAVHDLNRARSFDTFSDALRTFHFPAQNFAFAGRDGAIALVQAGKLPLRAPGQGVFIEDGADVTADWKGWIPYEHLPRVKDPPRAFVSSANQHPTDETYPYALLGSWNATSYTRARRLNEKLATENAFTAEMMSALQMDTVDLQARRVLPVLLTALNGTALTEAQQRAKVTLEGWNGDRAADSEAATLHDAWWTTLRQELWDSRFPRDGLQFPYEDRTAELLLALLNDSSPHAMPEAEILLLESGMRAGAGAGAGAAEPLTARIQKIRARIQTSFAQAVDSLVAAHGNQSTAWAWGRHRGTDLPHLASLPGLGHIKLFTGGHKNTINALTRKHGPSWRMVVAFGRDGVRARNILPGGASGHPGSRFYDDMIPDWRAGRLQEIAFLSGPDASLPGEGAGLTLTGAP